MMGWTPHLEDRWFEWLTASRFAGTTHTERQVMLSGLAAVRDRVLDRASVQLGDVLVDAGCGTGLLAFGALDRVGEHGHVLGVDVSSALLAELAHLAFELGMDDRLEVRQGSALALPLADRSVDVVVDRSVLIYVDDKPAAAREYKRVLCDGGRFSLFEPINGKARMDWGFDLGPVRDLHERVESRRQAHERADLSSMIGFDQDDLVQAFSDAGFVDLDLQMDQTDVAEQSGEA